MSVLVDSSVLCAYANEDDIHHTKSLRLINNFIEIGKMIISDYVFDEVMAVITRRQNRKTAIEFGKFLINSEEIIMIGTSEEVFNSAWEIFQKNENLSFTDCSLIACAEIFDIKKIATFDKHFNNIQNVEVIC